MIGTYTKLRSGEWGVRLAGELRVASGDVLTVQKKSGELKTEIAKTVVYVGQGVTLVAIQGQSNQGSHVHKPRTKWGCGGGQCYCPQCSRGSECLCRCPCGFGG